MKYTDKLKSAIDAATKANSNKDEISKTIDELNISVENFSDGKAALVIATKYKTRKNTYSAALAAAAGFLAGVQQDEYQAICLYDISKDEQYELAEWKVPKEGYPVVITDNGRDVYCYSRDELEVALADIISSVVAGEYLLKIMNNK
ncbi:TPA: hypothetical protein NHT78_000514 [Morganella morganii]|nr:hypothetical protein [Morganella morganii]